MTASIRTDDSTTRPEASSTPAAAGRDYVVTGRIVLEDDEGSEETQASSPLLAWRFASVHALGRSSVLDRMDALLALAKPLVPATWTRLFLGRPRISLALAPPFHLLRQSPSGVRRPKFKARRTARRTVRPLAGSSDDGEAGPGRRRSFRRPMSYGPGDVLTLPEAALALRMRDGRARAWLRASGLVVRVAGVDRVVWGAILEALAAERGLDRIPMPPPRRSLSTLPRVALG